MKILIYIFFIGSYFTIAGQSGDTCAGRPPERFRVLFVLDASYSMEKKWGKESMWDIAKKTIEEFSLHLQKNYSVEMGLRVYGHNSPAAMNDCEDSKLEVPIEENSAYKIIQRLKSIRFRGSTPLTYSLEKAADDLGCNSKKNMIILITDGYETCNANPCDLVEKLMAYRITIRPLIIGMNIDAKDIDKMNCIGDFTNAKDKDDFKKQLYKSFSDAANKRSISVFLRNETKQISETNIPLTITSSKSNHHIGSYYHTLATNMKPDTLLIGSYDSIDIKVHTTPSITKLKIPLKKYIHNLIEIPSPSGFFSVKWDHFIPNSIYEAPEIMVYKDKQWIYRTRIPDSFRLIKGQYDIQIATIPTIYLPNVEITSNKSHIHTLPAPGYLNLSKSSSIYADLYYYDKQLLTKCYTIQPGKTIENLTLLPGRYKLIYRTHRSITIHGTFEKSFEIKAGDLINLAL